MLISNLHDIRHIITKTQLLQRLGNVLARNRLLALLFGNLVCFRRDERDKLDAAFDEEVARVFVEGYA
jgi:hypothetical protein